MIFFRRFPPIMALLVLISFFYLEPAWGRGAYPYRFPDPGLSFDPQANTVVGVLGEYVTGKKDTLLDVARDNDLGFNQLENLYPGIDPWLPPEGTRLIIPTQWILPTTTKFGIVINIAEMRLFYFIKSIGLVRTYPMALEMKAGSAPLAPFMWPKNENILPGISPSRSRKSTR